MAITLQINEHRRRLFPENITNTDTWGVRRKFFIDVHNRVNHPSRSAATHNKREIVQKVVFTGVAIGLCFVPGGIAVVAGIAAGKWLIEKLVSAGAEAKNTSMNNDALYNEGHSATERATAFAGNAATVLNKSCEHFCDLKSFYDKMQDEATNVTDLGNCEEALVIARHFVKFIHHYEKFEAHLMGAIWFSDIVLEQADTMQKELNKIIPKYKEAMAEWLYYGDHGHCNTACYSPRITWGTRRVNLSTPDSRGRTSVTELSYTLLGNGPTRPLSVTAVHAESDTALDALVNQASG
jgi:hypothetical protein